jgi:hypothetical protein
MPSNSRARMIFIDPHLSKGALFTAREACSPAKEIVEKGRHVVGSLDRLTAEVILESKIDHPPISKEAVKFKRLKT